MWSNNTTQDIDYESLEKWKEQFENEREQQYGKVRQLQLDTQKRRKAMEMRIKLEAAKEEKRRRETLAERRAQHIEATMRFQKGIKNFKIDKEKISLEEALKSIEPGQKRINSAEDRYRVPSSPTNRHRVSTPKQKMQKSSSFDNVKYATVNFNRTDDTINQIIEKFDEFKFKVYPGPQKKENEALTVNNAILEHALKTNENVNRNMNDTPNGDENKYKMMLNQNQKTIENFNKEALNDFKNLVFNEVHKPVLNEISKNTINIKYNDDTYQEELVTKNKNENVVNYVSELIKVNNKFNDDVNKLDTFTKDETSSVSTEELSTDSRDSLEVHNDEIEIKKQKENFKEDIKTGVNFDNTEEKSLIHNNNNSKIQNHFLARNFNLDLTQNTILTNRKTYFAYPHLNTDTKIEDDKAIQTNNDPGQMTIITSKPFSAAINNKTQPQTNIKGILKRSKSETCVNYVNFNSYIRPSSSKFETKDSIEITNTRNQNKPKANGVMETVKKKSVRFAYSEDDEQQLTQENVENDASITSAKSKNSKALNTKKNAPSSKIAFINNGNITKTVDSNVNKDEYNDLKPPLPTNALNSDNTYLSMSQKRRDYLTKYKSKNTYELLNNSSASSNTDQNTSIISPHFMKINKNDNEVILQTNNINNNTSQPYILKQFNENKLASNINNQDIQESTQKFATKNETSLNTFNNKYGHADMNEQKKFFFTKINQVKNDNTNLNDTNNEQNENFRKIQNQQINIIKSPTVNTNIVQIQQLPNTFQNSAARPFSATVASVVQNAMATPLINQNNLFYQAYHSPKINSKFLPTPGRILSADYVNPNFKFKKYLHNPNPIMQFKLQYPSNEDSNKVKNSSETMTLSMAQFLKAEEMCNSMSESKVMHNLNAFENSEPRKISTKISLEEQQIKNSIQRLNDRLNMLNRKPSSGISSKFRF